MDKLRTQIETLQHLLVAHATGSNERDDDYTRLRQVLLATPTLEPLTPQFIRTCRSLAQFWQYIKNKFGTYAERRQFIWAELSPVFDALERGALAPSDQAITATLQKVDAAHVGSTPLALTPLAWCCHVSHGRLEAEIGQTGRGRPSSPRARRAEGVE